MKRRTFVLLSLYSSAAISIPFAGCSDRSALTGKPWVQPDVLAQTCDTKTLQEIGIAYRSRFATESKEEQLINLLLTDSTNKVVPVTAQDAFIHSLLEQKIQKEFETGHTVIVKGWVLAETEARQCALFSLTQK